MEPAITSLRLTARGLRRAEKYRSKLDDIVVGWESGEDGVEINFPENFINILSTDDDIVERVIKVVGEDNVIEKVIWRPRTLHGRSRHL